MNLLGLQRARLPGVERPSCDERSQILREAIVVMELCFTDIPPQTLLAKGDVHISHMSKRERRGTCHSVIVQLQRLHGVNLRKLLRLLQWAASGRERPKFGKIGQLLVL